MNNHALGRAATAYVRNFASISSSSTLLGLAAAASNWTRPAMASVPALHYERRWIQRAKGARRQMPLAVLELQSTESRTVQVGGGSTALRCCRVRSSHSERRHMVMMHVALPSRFKFVRSVGDVLMI